jgi:hypothetical protein
MCCDITRAGGDDISDIVMRTVTALMHKPISGQQAFLKLLGDKIDVMTNAVSDSARVVDVSGRGGAAVLNVAPSAAIRSMSRSNDECPPALHPDGLDEWQHSLFEDNDSITYESSSRYDVKHTNKEFRTRADIQSMMIERMNRKREMTSSATPPVPVLKRLRTALHIS